jgi:hypothetical protein
MRSVDRFCAAPGNRDPAGAPRFVVGAVNVGPAHRTPRRYDDLVASLGRFDATTLIIGGMTRRRPSITVSPIIRPKRAISSML